MSSPRVRVDLIDADGCVYNAHYQYLLFSVLDKYSSLLSSTPADKFTKEQVQEILDYVKAVELKYNDLTSSREKHQLCIANLREVVALHKSKIRKYMMDDVKVSFDGSLDISASFKEEDKKYFFHYAQHCLEKLNEIDPVILNRIFLAANTELVKELTANPDAFDRQVIMIGSARQDYGHDLTGSRLRLTNSIYRDLVFLKDHLAECYAGKKQVELNPVVLADVYGELELGESFRKILESVRHDKHHSAVYDRTKLTILYMAIHANPDAVQLNFYDDNWTIRNTMADVFYRHPVLMPHGLELRIFKYDGLCEMEHVVKGIGYPDEGFQNTIRQIYNLALINQPTYDRSYIDAAVTIDVNDFVDSHTAGSFDSNLAVLLDADGCFYNYLYDVMIMDLIHKFYDRINDATTSKSSSEAKHQLAAEMQAFIRDYDMNKIRPGDVGRYREFLKLRSIHKNNAIQKLHALAPYVIDDALFKANLHMFESLVSRANELECERITLMVGSNRQSYTLDSFNAKEHGTRPFYQDLERMVLLLNQKFGNEVEFHLDKFLLADVYSNLPAGTSFKRALRSDSHVIRHADSVWEDKKSHGIYGFLHYIAKHYPNTMAVEFIDDREDILQAIVAAYGNDDKHAVLPAHLPLRMALYNGDAIMRKEGYVINGCGQVDLELHKSLRMIAKSFGVESVSQAARLNKCIHATKFDGFYGQFAQARSKYKIKTVERTKPEPPSPVLERSLSASDFAKFGFFASDEVNHQPQVVAENTGWGDYVPGVFKGWFGSKN